MEFEQVIKKRRTHIGPVAGHTPVQEFIIVKEQTTKKKLRQVADKPPNTIP
jgi:hypothetical protein